MLNQAKREFKMKVPSGKQHKATKDSVAFDT